MALAALPPGPEGHYLTGNSIEYKRDPLGFLTRCAREYGDVVRMSLLGRNTYLLNHPDYIEHVLAKNNRNFIKSRSRYLHRFRQETIFRRFTFDHRRRVLATSETAHSACLPPPTYHRLR